MEDEHQGGEMSTLDMEIIVAELKLASPDLAEFVAWVAHQPAAESSLAEFQSVVELAVSFARAKNNSEE